MPLLKLLSALLATARSSLKSQHALALENLALRQQLAILRRGTGGWPRVDEEARAKLWDYLTRNDPKLNPEAAAGLAAEMERHDGPVDADAVSAELARWPRSAASRRASIAIAVRRLLSLQRTEQERVLATTIGKWRRSIDPEVRAALASVVAAVRAAEPWWASPLRGAQLELGIPVCGLD